MEALQNLLTIAVEVIAIAGLTGIFAHAIGSQHCRFMSEYCPAVKPFQEDAIRNLPQPEPQEILAQLEAKPEVKPVTEVTPAIEVAKIVNKPITTNNRKKVTQVKLQPMSVGSAAIDYSALTSEQLRKECALQGINWRSGGDYARPMKKAEMLSALR